MSTSNDRIFANLERQRDNLYQTLNSTTITALYKKEYDNLKAGRIIVFNKEQKTILKDLQKLAKDKSNDSIFRNIVKDYQALNNTDIIIYLQQESERVLSMIQEDNLQKHTQALFIVYDHYYDTQSSAMFMGTQDYPLIETPRYICSEIDLSNTVLITAEGIDFKPAWLNCEVLSEFDYLDIEFDMQELFQLHSFTLLHTALANLDKQGKLNFIENRPFSFYINEHDSEVKMLYGLA